jgi:YidC/Oxa1 family membrane protein insertase
MNNKNTIIGLLLIFAIFIIYSYLQKPSKEEEKVRKHKYDSITYVQNKERDSLILAKARQIAVEQAGKKLKTETGNPVDSINAVHQVLKEQLGVFAGSAAGKKESYTIESDLLKLRFTSKGGKID